MAAANESQGLKIAVAAFITLTVILTVSCYFLYSNGASAEARLQSVEESLRTKTKAESLALEPVRQVRGKVGTKATEYDPAEGEVDASIKKNDQRVDGMTRDGQHGGLEGPAEGAQGPELEDAKQNVQKAISSLRSEPKKNFISVLDRMTELMESLSLLTTELSLNYVGVEAEPRVGHSGEQAGDGRADQGRRPTAMPTTIGEQKRHEAERGTLLTKVDRASNGASTSCKGRSRTCGPKIKQQEEDYTRKIDGLDDHHPRAARPAREKQREHSRSA